MALGSEPRLVELREQLAAERAAGAAFSEAWERARAEALEGLSRFQRDAWIAVLAATSSAWQAAYEGRSSTPLDWVTELRDFAADGELEPLRYELPAA